MIEAERVLAEVAEELLDGCEGIERALSTASEELRAFVAAAMAELLGSADRMSAVEGHLPRGGDTVGRLRRVRARIRGLIPG